MQIKILDKRLGRDFPLPGRATKESAGMDLRAMLTEPLYLAPGQSEFIPSGIAIHINNPNVAAVLIPRSGLGAKYGIVLGNLVGLIDSDYQGPIIMSCWNRSNKLAIIEVGERIAQLVFIPVKLPGLEVVDCFGESTDRGEFGFGHTGTA